MPKKSSRAPLSLDHLDRIDRPTRERLYQIALEDEARERARELESKGWKAWYGEILGPEFITNLAPFHIEAIEWHWYSVVLRRAGLSIEKSTYPAVWFRGGRKSNIIRAIVLCDACLMKEGYALYVSGTKNKVRGHAISVESLIASPKVREYYPSLANVKRNIQGMQKSWTADLMYSESGYVFHFIGLSEGVAGANIDDVRPTIIVGDDLDDREDSPLISETRLKVFTRSVLPTRQRNTLVFIAQNYISRHGVVYRMHTGKERVLTNRVNTEPIPAVYDLVTEPRTIDGVIHDVIVSGRPSWPWYDIKRAQEEIDTIGLEAFEIECQHNVNADKAGQVLPEWNEEVHIITWSEFEAMYGVRDIPQHWRKYCGWDWGTTEGHDCAVSWLAVAAQNSPLPGTVFFYQLMSFPPSIITGQVCRRILNYLLEDLQRDPRNYIELDLLERAVGNPADPLAQRARDKIANYLSERDDFCMFHASHEAKAVRDVARIIYSLPFSACNPKKAGGVEQWRQHLRVDYDQPHPFRADADGMSRFYMVVSDDEKDRPRTDDGMLLARTEFPEWRWQPSQLTARGYLDERPLKQYDNVANSIMMLMVHFKMVAQPLSYTERLVQAIPENMRYETLLKNSPFQRGLLPEDELAHWFALKRARSAVTGDVEKFNEFGERVR